MSYEPTNWQAGDIVTSAKLNKLEQGVASGSGILVVHDENDILDKTWQEIYDAKVAVVYWIDNGYKEAYLINEIYIENNTYFVKIGDGGNGSIYNTSSPDDYPIYNKEVEGGVMEGGGTK